jgi:uncharacterized protein YraI
MPIFRRRHLPLAFIAALTICVGSIHGAHAQSQGVELVVTSPTLNVRSAPSTGDSIIGQLTCGQKVIADAKTADGAWYRINYNGRSGFIYAQFAVAGGTCATANASAAPAASAPAAGGTNITVTSEVLNVRSAPSLSGSILGRLKRGDVVSATARTTDGKWLEIVYNNGKGYVFAQYTSFGGATPAAATLAAAPAAAAPAAAPPAAPSGKWTFELGGHMGSTAVFGQMRDIGMTWVKFQTQDTDIPGRIAAAKAAGLKVLIGAVGERSRAADPNYHKEFAAYLAQLVTQGADGIEVWNEPNLDREYGGPGNGQVNPENYANMLREAYIAIKAANPNALVIGAAMAPTGYFGGNCTNAGCDDAPFLQRLAATGAAQWMDCIGAHHNGTMVGPDQTSGAPVANDHHQWYFWGTLNVTYNAFGGKIPVCWTELGYVTPEGLGPIVAPNFQWGNGITLANQAQWLARAAQLSRDSGKVRLMIIWNMDRRQYDAEDPQAGYSIFRPDGSCPACAGLRAVMGR